MLLRNGINGNIIPITFLGGGFMPGNHDTAWPGIFVGGVRDVAAVPFGRTHPLAIVMPKKAGGMSTGYGVSGSGGIEANGYNARRGSASMTGSGGLEAFGALIVSMSATMEGSGTISEADIKGFLQLAATMEGSGGLEAAISALGAMAADMTGSGGLEAEIGGIGSMSATMEAGGELLTTANVGDAVLDALNGVEDDYTLRQALRIILAALGGKVSISGSTVTFRDVNDTTDRIVATTDENGQRTAVTLDAD